MITISIDHPLKHFTFKADLTIPSTGITTIFGPSGAGKTTLLNFISGKNKPNNGYIAIGDRVLFDSSKRINQPPHRRKIGYVFQESNLFPHYSVRGNLFYGAPKKEENTLMTIAHLLDIVPLLDERIAHLSGGEKQRIAIGRALLSNPSLLLMDEPLASLDHARKEEIMTHLLTITDTIKIPILYVTHNREEAKTLSSRYIEIDCGKTALKSIHTL